MGKLAVHNGFPWGLKDAQQQVFGWRGQWWVGSGLRVVVCR